MIKKASAGSFLAEAKFVFSHKLRKNLTNRAFECAVKIWYTIITGKTQALRRENGDIV